MLFWSIELSRFYSKFIHIMFAILGLSMLYSCSSGASCNSDNDDSSTNLNQYKNWIESLTAADYGVIQGNVFLMQNDNCPQFVSIFNSCFGQNPASPYIIPQLPIESSYVDPYYAIQFESNTPSGVSVDMFYRLSDTDAMVTVVAYPPKAAYFGYQSYVFTRESSYYDGIVPPRSRSISPDPSRYDIFGSIGNDINNTIVQNQYGRSPWNGSIVMYITTSNQALADALVLNATNHGINRNSIFIEPVGTNVMVGKTESADDMLTLIRYAVPESSNAATSWNSTVNENTLVYRISNQQIPVSRYGQNSYSQHLINNSESNLNVSLEQLSTLLKIYLEQHQPLTISATIAQTLATTFDNDVGEPSSGLVGSYCIEYGNDCEGDNQDTSTYATLTESTVFLGPDEVVFIAGVNHSLPNINNNHYLSLDIYNAVNSSGVASTSKTNLAATGFSSGNLNGSAQQLLMDLGIVIPANYTELRNNIGSLYASFVSRNCNNKTIHSASPYCINLLGDSLVPSNATISITERSYVLPGKTTGAYTADMVYPYLIANSSSFIPNP